MEDQIKEYAKELRSLIDKSNDTFEKQLNYISSGTLAISMIIVEKLVKDLSTSTRKWMLILSWTLLGLTLVSNLLSHIYTAKTHGKTITEIDANRYDYDSAVRRNKRINWWNLVSVFFMLFGILFLILFITYNI